MGVHIPTLPDAARGIERGGSLRSRPHAPARHRRSGGRSATARRRATCGTVGVPIGKNAVLTEEILEIHKHGGRQAVIKHSVG